MKYIITEQQYMLILEQRSDYAMDRQSNAILRSTGIRNQKDYSTVNTVAKKAEDSTNPLLNVDKHTAMTILQIGTAFIPVVGPFISAGIGLADAAMYYNEGDKKTAGLVGVFSMLPFVGKIVSKIPGVKQLGTKGMALLASKLSKGGSNLTKAEVGIVNAIKMEKNLINSELNSASEILKSIGKNIDTHKAKYISKYGQSKYDELLSSLLSKKITPKSFIQNLETKSSSVGSAAVKNLVKVYRAGPKKSSMFYVSPSRDYVVKNYSGDLHSMTINLGKILDLTKINAESIKITQLLEYLKSLGVKFTKEETTHLLNRFSNKSTKFKKVYQDRPLWQFINFENSIADAAKRSGFDSIKQFETSSLKGGNWDWSKGDISYFILNLIQ
jgi:hypothetical protein